jgi:endonuclease III
MTNSDLCTLQSKLIYSMIVAGKSAKFANEACKKLLAELPPGRLPFDWLKAMNGRELENELRRARTGQYERLGRGLHDLALANIDLATCGPEELEEIKGIGPKTARFWLLWTRPDANYAALDVHVLRWMRSLGYKAPKHTPSSRKEYARLEHAFLEEARKRGVTTRELDFAVWQAGATEANVIPEAR